MTLHGRTVMCSPLSASLQRHYPPSPVLSGHRTAYASSAFLRQLSGIPLWRTSYGKYRLSPVDAVPLCNMTDLRPRGAAYVLTISAHLHIAFRYEHSVGAPVSLYFGAEMPYAPITSLSTLSPQRYRCVPKTCCQWLVRPFWMGFPPALHHTLCWAHAHL